jgi:hypothetical protein
MKKLALVSALVLGISTVTWGYHITGISVSPANPTPTSSISITVSGWKPASNYSIQRSSVRVVGKTIMFDIYWQTSGCGCQVVTDYTRTETVGRLAAGTYTVSVRSFLKCRVCAQMTKSFTVSGSSSGGCGCTCICHRFPSCRWMCHCHCGGSGGDGVTSSTSTSSAQTSGSGTAVADTAGNATAGNSSSSSSSHSASTGN